MMKEPGQVPNNADNEMDLRRLVGLLVDHRWMILFITVLFALGGVAYAFLAVPVYQGDALVQVERRSTLSPLTEYGDMFGKETEAMTSAEVEILKSRLVLGQVVDRQDLVTSISPRLFPVVGDYLYRRDVMPRPDFLAGKPYAWRGEHLKVGLLQVARQYRDQEMLLRSLGGDIYLIEMEEKILGEGQVGQLESFLDGDVELRVAELSAPPGVEFHVQQQSREVAIKKLKDRLSIHESGEKGGPGTGILVLTLTGADPDEVRRTLDAVIETFLGQNVQRQSAEAEKSLEFLRAQAPELRRQLALSEEKLNEYRANMNSVDLSSEAQATVDQFISVDQQLNELKLTEAELSQRFTPNHPTYQTLLRKRQQLLQERAELEERVSELPETQQEVVRLTRDVEVTQSIYVNVLNKMQEMEVARAGTVGNVRIIDSAMVGRFPIRPDKPLTVVLSTILGAVVAIGLVLLRAMFHRGVEISEQIEHAGLPVYAIVPHSDRQWQLSRRVRRGRGTSSHPGVLAEREPTEVAVESIRALRTSLHFAMLGTNSNLMSITGPSPGTGKSFIAVNLAMVCAQTEQRVLLVDADMRKGKIHRAFGDHGGVGLSELLVGKVELEEAVRCTKLEHLHYISRGVVPPNPSELLMNARFSKFLEEVRQCYDLVILDTPPVLAVTDASIISKQCGTTMMVIRFQMNPMREIRVACRRMEVAGVTIKGAIFNAVERKAATSYGYGYYTYAYK